MVESTLPRSRVSLQRLAVLTFMAWRSVWRNPVRSLLTALAMAVGVVLIVAALALIEGLTRQMTGYATDLELGEVQVHRREFIDAQDLYAVVPWSLLEHLETTTADAYAPRLYAAALGGSGDYSTGVMIKAIDPQREARVTRLNEHVRTGDFRLGPPRRQVVNPELGVEVPVYPVVIGAQLARNLHVEVGGELVLITQAADGSIGNGLFRVAGVLRPINLAFDRSGVLMSIDAFQYLMVLDSGVHELAVSTPQAQQEAQDKQRIEAAVQSWTARHDPGYGGDIVVRTWQEINPSLAQLLEYSNASIMVIAVIIFAIAALGMVNTMLMAVYERQHEFGILLAMGMGRFWLLGMVMLEAFFLSIVAAVVGSAGGVALAAYLQIHGWDFSSYLPEGLDWAGVVIEPIYKAYLLPEHVVYGVAFMMVLGLLGALFPSWRTVRLRPAQVLHP